jgi:RNA-directed DNA polymerase
MKSHFDTIDHSRLMELVRQRVVDGSVLALLEYVGQWTGTAGLSLHPTKTRIVHVAEEGFDFLGWRFRGGRKWPRRKSVEKLRGKLRPLTRRSSGRSLREILAQANPILRGWHGSCTYG